MPKNTSAAPARDEIASTLMALHDAIQHRRSRVSCLRRWSDFIRARDAHRCVDCHETKRLSAHHICRKSFLPAAQFQTGNGITLCRDCHRDTHLGFNGRPDLSLPVDAQGGEKLDRMERLYSILVDDAVERGMMCDEYYYLSDDVLEAFRRMQGYGPETSFPGSRIEQAFLILAETEHDVRAAIAAANGFASPGTTMLPGGLMLTVEDVDGRPGEQVIVRRYLPRSGSKLSGSR